MASPARGGDASPSSSSGREEGELSPTASGDERREALAAAASARDGAGGGAPGGTPVAAWLQERAQWSGSDGEGDGGRGGAAVKRQRKRRKRRTASGSDASDASDDEAEPSDAPAARRQRTADSRAAVPCRHWAAASCARGTACAFLHLGKPGSAAARNAVAAAAAGDAGAPAAAAVASAAGGVEPPPGMALVPIPLFSPEQASRFRELLASPNAAARFEEVRALVGPLIPLRPGAPPAAGAAQDEPPHPRNCGCAACRESRPGGGGEAEAEAAEGEEAVAQRRLAVAARLDACRTITHPRSVDAWRAVLVALRRA